MKSSGEDCMSCLHLVSLNSKTQEEGGKWEKKRDGDKDRDGKKEEEEEEGEKKGRNTVMMNFAFSRLRKLPMIYINQKLKAICS